MASNRSHLSVEVLEDRLVLSTFPALDGLATELLRFTPPATPSLQASLTNGTPSSFTMPAFSGFSNAPAHTDPNLLGFGPVDQGIPGLTATAGPANFPQTTAQTTPATGLTQAQASALTQFAATRLAAAQFLAIEAAQAAATPTTTPTAPTTTPNASLLAAQVFVAQLQAAQFAAAAAQVQAAQAQAASSSQTGAALSNNALAGTATINLAALNRPGTSTGGGVFSSNGSTLNPFLPTNGFAVGPATGATGTGVFAGGGGGANAALPAGGFPLAGTTLPAFGFTYTPSIFSANAQAAALNAASTVNSQDGMNPFNNALAASGFR